MIHADLLRQDASEVKNSKRESLYGCSYKGTVFPANRVNLYIITLTDATMKELINKF